MAYHVGDVCTARIINQFHASRSRPPIGLTPRSAKWTRVGNDAADIAANPTRNSLNQGVVGKTITLHSANLRSEKKQQNKLYNSRRIPHLHLQPGELTEKEEPAQNNPADKLDLAAVFPPREHEKIKSSLRRSRVRYPDRMPGLSGHSQTLMWRAASHLMSSGIHPHPPQG